MLICCAGRSRTKTSNELPLTTAAKSFGSVPGGSLAGSSRLYRAWPSRMMGVTADAPDARAENTAKSQRQEEVKAPDVSWFIGGSGKGNGLILRPVRSGGSL